MTFFSSRNLIVIVATGCSALVVLLLIGQDIAAAVSKLVASSAFVALAIQVGGLRSNYGRLILLGLVFSWFGDAFLIGETQTFFLLGLGAFLLAHVTYIAAFIALPIAAIALAVSAWLAPHVQPELAIPVRGYTAAISLMVIAAFGTRGRGASILILTGAVLFFLSDLSVAALRLVQTDFPTYTWGLPLYYAGQVCLALSTSQSRSH
jgi:uncharacterized membrane protein YhhN